MLFSNWIITENPTTVSKLKADTTGVCLDIQNIKQPFNDLLYTLQQLDPRIALSVLITDKVATTASADLELYLDNLISLFYQPGFYIKNEGPVIFVAASSPQASQFINTLEKECLEQGYKQLYSIHLAPVADHIKENVTPVAYELDGSEPDLKVLTDKWVNNWLQYQNHWPITLLLPEKSGPEKLEALLQKQKAFIAQPENKVISELYEVIQKNEEYKFQLYLKGINEQNNRAYLEFQKQDLAKILDFYKYEHEILPMWYKRFGQIIKVILGKRTFKSLFSDNVKKYNKS